MVDGKQRRARATKRPIVWLVVWAALGPTLSSACDDDRCDGEICLDESDTRLLDRVCRASACAVSGAAKQTTGVTAGLVGFQLGGPRGEEGTVTIRLEAAEQEMDWNGDLQLYVLAAARESGATPSLYASISWAVCEGCTAPNAVLEVSDEYRWHLVTGPRQTAVPAGQGAVLTLTGAGIDIADIRADTISVDDQGCL